MDALQAVEWSVHKVSVWQSNKGHHDAIYGLLSVRHTKADNMVVLISGLPVYTVSGVSAQALKLYGESFMPVPVDSFQVYAKNARGRLQTEKARSVQF